MHITQILQGRDYEPILQNEETEAQEGSLSRSTAGMKRWIWIHSQVPKAYILNTLTLQSLTRWVGWKPSSPFSSPNPPKPHLPPPTSALFPVLQAALHTCLGSVESTTTQRVRDALRLDECLPLTRSGARVFCPCLPQCPCPQGEGSADRDKGEEPRKGQRVDLKPRAVHRVACFMDKVYPRPAQGVRGHARAAVAQGRALQNTEH